MVQIFDQQKEKTSASFAAGELLPLYFFRNGLN